MDNICPDCGRKKAINLADVSNGLCPKWWAIHDPLADDDCKRVASQQQHSVDIESKMK